MQIQCNVIKCCHDFHVKKLLFLGSTCIYPKMAPQPIPEDALLTGPLEETNEAYEMCIRDRPYVETDATNPHGAYGSTKLAGENFVKDFADRYFILRTAWLYGDGKNFAKTMLRLSEDHDMVTVVGDKFGSPLSLIHIFAVL